MVERRDLYQIPDLVAERIEVLLPEINNVLAHQPDFPHGAWHAEAVWRDVLYAAQMFDLSPEEIELARSITEVHDDGYKFVSAGILPPDEHHIGSYLMAKHKFSDEVVARGALLHNQDVMPEDEPFVYSLIRDIDRLQFMGWGGVIRSSYYLGFRPFGMTEHDPKKINKAVSLFEARTPDKERVKTEVRVNHCFPTTVGEVVKQTDFERRAKVYSWLHMFPFLYQKGRLNELKNLCWGWLLDWEEGRSYYKTPGNHLVPKGEEYDPEKEILTVEPISDWLRRMFGAKFFNTYDAIYAIDAWIELHPDGVKRRSKLEEMRWARNTYYSP